MDEGCRVEPVHKSPSAQEQEGTARALLAIEGMGCPNCAARVHNSLIRLNGVVEAHVALEERAAMVVFNPALVSTAALLVAVAQAGNDSRHDYRARLIH